MLSEHEQALLDMLSEKLKGKPVADTLRDIAKGKTSKAKTLKGLFSLCTHVAIEIEHGKIEYFSILNDLYKIIGVKLKAGIQ